MRHRRTLLPGISSLLLRPTAALLVLCSQSACDLGSRAVGSDADALPSGQTFETRVSFDVEYVAGYPSTIALADDGSFVVVLVGIAPADEFRGSHFVQYDAEGSIAHEVWDPSSATAYDVQSAEHGRLFLSRQFPFQTDDSSGDDLDLVRLAALTNSGSIEPRAEYPCTFDSCRLTYAASAGVAWTVSDGVNGLVGQRWDLDGEPIGPAVTLPSTTSSVWETNLRTTEAGGITIATYDGNAGGVTVSTFGADGSELWTTTIDASSVDHCTIALADESTEAYCDIWAGDGAQAHRGGVDSDGVATPISAWAGDSLVVPIANGRHASFGPTTLTVLDATGAVIDAGPSPMPNPSSAYTDVANGRVALISDRGESSSGFVASIAVVEIE